ncbi:MAG: M4 family metallopeptidase [Crocinitomicaceae bacterium]
MKLSNLSFNLKVIALSICLSPLFGQAQEVFTGIEASRMYEKAAVVRSSKHSALPSYIKFKTGEEIPFGDFQKWTNSAFKLNPAYGYQLKSTETDQLGHIHYRYNQTFNGIVLEHATWIVHTKDESVYAMNGTLYSAIQSGNQSISESAALQQALNFVGADTYKWELPIEEGHLKMETKDENATYYPEAELVYASKHAAFTDDSYRLAYKFNIYAHQPVSRAEIYVDANSGEIIFENEVFHHIDVTGSAVTAYSGTQSIVADSFNGEFRLREASRGNGINTYDMNEGTNYGAAVDFTDADNIWDNANGDLDEYATDAHWGAEMTYDYFWLEHSRNSIDDNGFALNSYVHYDVQYANAFWDGQRMTYGDGNGTTWNPLTALDIAGHEVSHGLTNFTANLVYNAESGALNESFSDIFGTSIENFARPTNWNWLIGEDIGSALRSMQNPNAYGDPDTYFGTNWASLTGGDNGGVHTNSGVQNFWYYLLVTGGTGTNDIGDSYTVSGLGFDEASDIAFRNLTVYLTDNSDFADARFYSIQSAVDLFGGCTPQVEATTNAWYAVGVGPEYISTVLADMSAPVTIGCSAPFIVDFSNSSINGTSFTWDFGDGNTSTDVNPSHSYMADGLYTVQLIADGGLCGIDTTIFVDYISVDPVNPCVVNMPDDGVGPTQTICDGTLYDSGGASNNYGADEDAQITISPLGAATVDLDFVFFDIEPGQAGNCNYDWLEVYDGSSTSAPSIGTYCNDNPPTTLSSTGGSMTLVFHSDGGLEQAGFQIDWTCNYPTVPPTANWTSSVDTTCNGEVTFTDLSTDGPSQWDWDFGDGNTSTDQHPTHTYSTNGDFTVTLTVTNLNGNDVMTVIDAINVTLPVAPSGTGATICENETADLMASGSGGTYNWYDAASGGTQLGSGSPFTTSALSTTTSFFVEEYTAGPQQNFGPTDNTFGTGGFFNGDQHLVFDVIEPVILKSVLVYANGGGDRTIELRNSAGIVVQSLTVNIPNGPSTVNLDFDLEVGTDWQLGTAPGSNQDLYRNNSGPTYPYTAGGGEVIITQASPGLDWYYFFYDWLIEKEGCKSARTEVIATVNAQSDATIDPILPLCTSDSPITLNAADAGGTWSGTGVTGTSFDPSAAGTGNHTITYTISGSCGASDNLDVTVADSYDATITNPGVLCSDAAALNLISVDGGGTWSGNGITDAANGLFDPNVAGPGTHTIDYTIGGSCGDTDQIDIIIEERPDPTVDPAGPFCRYESAYQMTATTFGGTWSADCGSCISSSGVFDPNVAGAGVWMIYYSVGGICSDASTTAVLVNDCLGIEDQNAGFKIYPNPTSGEFVIFSEQALQGELLIEDLSGRVVYRSTLNEQNTTVDISHLADGNYIFVFNSSQSDERYIQKIVKQ